MLYKQGGRRKRTRRRKRGSKRRHTRKKKRRRRKRRTRRKRGGTQTQVGSFIITESSKPTPGIAMAIAIDKTYKDKYDEHCDNHSRGLYRNSPTWRESTAKDCKQMVKTFKQLSSKRR